MADRTQCRDRRRLTPPWADARCWQQVNRWLGYWIDRRRSRLKPAVALARHAAGILQGLFARMDELCAGTCRYCPDPCCRSACPWFDFADLLLLQLIDESVPPYQTSTAPGQMCRYLGSRGCRLPRPQRPFICTWYRCPTQRLRANGPQLDRLSADIGTVKALRRRMEDAFVRAVR